MDYPYGNYVLSDDPGRLDLSAVHAFLHTAYWSEGISLETVGRAVQGSLCVGVYDGDGAQVGFARFISDHATFCYVCDVYVLEAHRGRGLAREILHFAHRHPELQGLRRWMLVTKDAHELYQSVGFRPVAQPERHMEINVPDIYKQRR